jgi:hypothetical protein
MYCSPMTRGQREIVSILGSSLPEFFTANILHLAYIHVLGKGIEKIIISALILLLELRDIYL